MTAASFCTVTASTKRNPAPVAGRITAPVTSLSSILITQLWPVSPQTVSILALNSPREAKECYHVPVGTTTLPDVREGDVLTVSATDYIVISAAEWTDADVPTLQIVVQQVKQK